MVWTPADEMLSLLPSIRRGFAQKRRLHVSAVVNGSNLAKLIRQTTCVRHLTVKSSPDSDNSSFFADLAKKTAVPVKETSSTYLDTNGVAPFRSVPSFKSHTFEDGTKYEGGWQDNMMQGHGKLISPNREVFTGTFDTNMPIDGEGVIHLKDGTTYHGAFVDGKRHGFAKTQSAAGGVAECHYQYNKRIGAVKYTYTDGNEYEGEMVRYRKHGQGRLTYSHGHTLEGEFRDGKIFNGHGFVALADGGSYVGEFKQGLPHGTGRITSVDGEVVQGQFRHNRVHTASGVHRGADGAVFSGFWLDGHWHGQGKLTFRDGRSLSGEFKNGKLVNGTGAMSQPDGSWFEGTWVAGKWHGQGKLTYADGHSVQGEYKDGALWTGSGCVRYPSGDTYVGQVVDGKRHGPGKFTSVVGNVQEGEWRNGRLVNTNWRAEEPVKAPEVVPEAVPVVVQVPVGAPVSATVSDKAVTPVAVAVDAPLLKAEHLPPPVVPTTPSPGDRVSFTNKQGMVYEGVVVNEAEKHGKGRISYRDGSVYEGEWVKERRHGPGQLTSATGDVFQGVFERDVPVSGRGVLAVKDGGRYEGELVQGKRHGRAKITNAAGEVLEVEYSHGLRVPTATATAAPTPKRVAVTPTSKVSAADAGSSVSIATSSVQAPQMSADLSSIFSKAAGEIESSLPRTVVRRAGLGTGTVTYPNGSVYTGKLRFDYPHGAGELVYTTGQTQVGRFRKGKFHTGTGVMHLKNGAVYEGEVLQGRWHGQGRLTTAEGRVLEGEFREGKIFNGHGALLLPNGTVFEGAWTEGKKHGPGTLTSAEGKVMSGEFRENKIMSGEGTMVGPDGKVFEGKWKNFRFFSLRSLELMLKSALSPPPASPADAQNVHIGARGEVAEVKEPFNTQVAEFTSVPEVRVDAPVAPATVHTRAYVNGTVYVGEMVDGRRHGPGQLTSATGDVFQGVFERDVPVSGRGVLAVKDGGRYEGELVQGKRHGQGKLTHGDGSIQEGEFRAGKLFNGTVTQNGSVEKWTDGVRVVVRKEKSAVAKTPARAVSPSVVFPSVGLFSTSAVLPKNFSSSTTTTTTATTAAPSRQASPQRLSTTKEPKKVLYPDGSSYTGELVSGSKHGQGTITYPDGRTLEGEFRQGKIFNGHGLMRFPNGDEVEGTWSEGRKNGAATVTYPDGRTLQGVFKNGQLRSGSGVLKLPHCVQEGTWVEGKLSGQGNVVYTNNGTSHTLSGIFRTGRIQHGEGTFVTRDHTLYSGTWVNGLHTQGTVQRPDGSVLEVKNGRAHSGTGVTRMHDGSVYDGEWAEGRFEGQGRLMHATGQAWEGIFRDGRVYTGSGATSGQDSVHQGEWVEGRKHGFGRESWFDGSIYEGSFVEGKRHGQGKLTRQDSTVEGEFRDGKIYNGTGVVLLKDGEKYDVVWTDGVPLQAVLSSEA